MHPGLSRPRLGQAFYLRDDSASQGPKRKTHRSFSPIFFSVHTRLGIWVWSLVFWEALVFLARGVGIVTNGAVRSIPTAEALGFQVFAAGVSVSHAYTHIVEFGTPVEVDGLKVHSGALLQTGDG